VPGAKNALSLWPRHIESHVYMCWFEGSNGEVVQQVGIRWLREMLDCYGRC